jgi:prophage regulatory protein
MSDTINLDPARPAPDRLMALPEVVTTVGICASTIYSRIAAGTFPQARRLSAGCVRWRESEIAAWIDALPTAGAQMEEVA